MDKLLFNMQLIEIVDCSNLGGEVLEIFEGERGKKLLISEYLCLMHLIFLIIYMILNVSGMFYFVGKMFKEEDAQFI